MNKYAIKIENITKQYTLGTIGWGTLKEDLQSYIAKRRGKEDPNAPIYYNKDKEFNALKDISLEIEKGSVVGIIGANGAGKSTLLKLISGLTIPTKGKIYLNGKVTSILEAGVGFHGELTGRENIYLNGSILGMKKDHIDTLIDDIIEFAEIRQFIDTPVKRYSSGMYIRLGFSVAVHLLSDIVIIDEALAVGDVNFQKKALNKLKELAHSSNRTILYVSHNMSTIKDLCQKCIVLDKGQLKYFGAVDKAIELYRNQSESKEIKKILTKKDHAIWLKPRYTKMNEISLINKNDNLYSTKDKIGIKFEWDILEKTPNIGLKLIISNYDHEPIGFSNYYGPYNIKKDKGSLELYYEFPNLITGSYYTTIALYQYDKENNEIIDDLCNSLNLKIEDKEDITWDTPKWGSIKFNKPTQKHNNK